MRRSLGFVVVACGLLGLLAHPLGCAKHSDKEYAKCQRVQKLLADHLSQASAEARSAKEELAKLKATPEFVFRTAVEKFEAWSNEGTDAELIEANNGFDKVITQFPKSALVEVAARYKARTQAVVDRLEAMKKQRALAVEPHP